MPGKRPYAEKVASGQQIYGDGSRCCAHRVRTISNQLPPHNKDVIKWEVPVAQRSDARKLKQ